MTESNTFRTWLRNEVRAVLNRKGVPPPLVLWCDPDGSWRDILKHAADGGTFELWSDGDHELVLRDLLMKTSPTPRVVWLPVASDEISYLKVFELQAEFVWTESLVSALARFGVEIARDHEAGLRDMLRAYAIEHVDQPLSSWRELTPGNAKATLVDDDHILASLARTNARIADVIGEDRLGIFKRRVTEDFGLPAPVFGKDDEWRIAAMAHLLVTDAATRIPAEPPGEGDKVIPLRVARDRALKLLDRWQKNIELMGAFEDLSRRADASTSLVHWARNLSGHVPALASRAAEDALFQREVDRLAQLEEFDPLARHLEEHEPAYAEHARAFWGSRAEQKVAWQSLVSLARAAALIRQQSEVEKGWKAPYDAVAWFTTSGWEIDRQGEQLFRDDAELPGGLHGVRARLRRAYLRHLDKSNAAFSELLHHHGVAALGLPFAGEVLASVRPTKDPMAVLVLDACRYDLGARIAEQLDKGEPVRRSQIQPAQAPLPSITALGMPFALADDAGELTVELTNDAPVRWRVTASDGRQDLTVAEARREWLRQRFKLKPAATTDVKSVLDADPPSPKESGRLLFVFGDEFDVLGHEGELKFTGADDHVERYVRVVRRLRDAGYSTVAIVTDHGFIHWEPDQDEVENLPTGEILWRSRRAVAGRGLKHSTAIAADIRGSELQCRVPRSVNAFRTYGGIGFFHGGATLQELITPVVVFRWPKKAEKVAAVLTPISEITSLKPRVEVRLGAGQTTMFGMDASLTSRQIVVKVVESGSGRRLFKSQSHKVEPEGQPLTIVLEREPNESCSRGAHLEVQVRDADNDELLDRCNAELKVDLEEWD
ncbi:alkaline phosphatase domain-containing protein [Caballeronia arvi]|uniref:Alkaline phosphatase domain-containing protein n=1 Tax=Caballeronia arvi TaxID=1777135 RepID=A0A158HDT5_9BURK|nr:PglZ domain-containing protein [Caballeronia arvi]SAL42337.1 alkaline phosphatase domain-containing protein [Caballeronia arvi]